jgi:2-hydroxychromene-2-carboxylate isomerase
MARIIDYYFTINSPWTYLGHDLFHAIAAKHGALIRYKPVPLADVFDATGSLPLPKRPPARQRYRFVELQRWSDKRGLPLNLKPQHFPLDPTLINRTLVAVIAEGGDPGQLARSALAGVWAEDRNLNDEVTVRDLLSGVGFDADGVIAAARSEKVSQIFAKNGEEAIAADVFGAPAYVLDGEFFWGQDRLELLDDALSSGRAPYRTLS